MVYDNVLVTAIYSHGPFSRMGGRGYGMYMYNAALLNLFKLNLPVVVYTHDAEYEGLKKFIELHKIENCHIELFDLTTIPFFNRIMELKEQSGLIDKDGLVKGISEMQNVRNHTLCLYKPFFVKDAMDKKWFDGKNYYWIDAGLFHHGLFPNSLGGMEYAVRIDEQLYWPTLSDSLFRPGLIEKLLEKTSEQFIFIKALQGYSMPPWWSSATDSQFYGHIIGGLFGGKKELFVELVERFETLANKLLKDGHLVLEEVILSACYADKFNTHSMFEFETWYHDIVTDRCGYEMHPDTKCFYKIFKVFDN